MSPSVAGLNKQEPGNLNLVGKKSTGLQMSWLLLVPRSQAVLSHNADNYLADHAEKLRFGDCGLRNLKAKPIQS